MYLLWVCECVGLVGCVGGGGFVQYATWLYCVTLVHLYYTDCLQRRLPHQTWLPQEGGLSLQTLLHACLCTCIVHSSAHTMHVTVLKMCQCIFLTIIG